MENNIMKQCPSCGQEVPKNYTFCDACGAEQKNKDQIAASDNGAKNAAKEGATGKGSTSQSASFNHMRSLRPNQGLLTQNQGANDSQTANQGTDRATASTSEKTAASAEQPSFRYSSANESEDAQKAQKKQKKSSPTSFAELEEMKRREAMEQNGAQQGNTQRGHAEEGEMSFRKEAERQQIKHHDLEYDAYDDSPLEEENPSIKTAHMEINEAAEKVRDTYNRIVNGSDNMPEDWVGHLPFVSNLKMCVLRKFADFSGRATRGEFWWFQSAYFIIGVLGVFFKVLLDEMTPEYSSMGLVAAAPYNEGFTFGMFLTYAIAWIFLAAYGLLTLPALSVTIRRLHDIGRSAFWVLLFLMPPIGVLILLILMLIPTEERGNEYGPIPDYSEGMPQELPLPEQARGLGWLSTIKYVFTKKFAAFEGRETRSVFWKFYIGTFIVAIVLQLLINIIYHPIAYYVMMLYFLAFLIPTIALMVRRLHDMGRSGGWVFINFIPIIGNLWFHYYMGQPSVLHENEYGPLPNYNPYRDGNDDNPIDFGSDREDNEWSNKKGE